MGSSSSMGLLVNGVSVYSFFQKSLMFTYLGKGLQVPWHTCGEQKTTCGCHSSIPPRESWDLNSGGRTDGKSLPTEPSESLCIHS